MIVFRSRIVTFNVSKKNVVTILGFICVLGLVEALPAGFFCVFRLTSAGGNPNYTRFTAPRWGAGSSSGWNHGRWFTLVQICVNVCQPAFRRSCVVTHVCCVWQHWCVLCNTHQCELCGHVVVFTVASALLLYLPG